MTKDFIYLDNSATTQMSEAAKRKMIEAADEFGNPSSLHAAGDRAARLLREARREILSTLGIKAMSDEQDKQLVFTSSGTEASALALLGTAHAKKRREANRIITTDSEHPSVEKALKMLEEEGFEIIRLSTLGGVLSMSELESALQKPVFMASIMLVNNETGALYDVKGAFEKIKRRYPDAITHCDAVQGYLKVRISPTSLCADLITVSAHKIHAPKGVGALYIAPHMLKERKIAPVVGGGGQEHGLRSGTENVTGIAAFGAAAKEGYADLSCRMTRVSALRALCEKMICESAVGIAINKPRGARVGHILSICLPNIKSQTMLNFLSGKGIYVSSGSACSSHSNKTSKTLLAFGLTDAEADSTLRISFSAYNDEDDVKKLVEALSVGVNTLVKIKK